MSDSNFALFLGDLSVFCTREDLLQLLSPFGRIVDIRIKQDINTGKKLSYGFVEFDNINSAMAVMNNLNGYVLCGRPLRIRLGASKTAKKPVKREVSPAETSSVHVSYCVRAYNVLVTEESLRYLFGAYGFVLDATVKKAVCNNMRGSNEGYGFVHYDSTPQGVESAFRAVAAMNNAVINGVQYKVSLSATLESRLNDQMNMTPMRLQQQPCYPQQAMYYPAAPVASATPSSYYNVVPPPSYYSNNQPQLAAVYCQAPAAPSARYSSHHYRPAVPSIAPEAVAPSVLSSPRSTPVSPMARTSAAITEVVSVAATPAPAPAPAVYEITLTAKKLVDDEEDMTSSSSSGNTSGSSSPRKVMPALHSEVDLQRQLDQIRDDIASCKHSTIDVYMDMQEHQACVDICDY